MRREHKRKELQKSSIIIAVIIGLLIALVGKLGINAYFTSQKSLQNTFTIQSRHNVTYTYYEVDRNGNATKLDRTETEKKYKETVIILGDDSSHVITDERYTPDMYYKIDNVVMHRGDSFVVPGRDVTIESYYTLAKYNVTYNFESANGGQVSQSDTTKTLTEEFNIGENIDLTKTGYLQGYDFDGWVLNGSSQILSTLTMGNSNVTLNAVYTDRTAPNNTAPAGDAAISTITVTPKQEDNGSEINTNSIKYQIGEDTNGNGVIDENEWREWQDTNTFTGLTANTTYYVRTQASDNDGNGPTISESTEVTTLQIENGTLVQHKTNAQGEIIPLSTDSADRTHAINTDLFLDITPAERGTTTLTIKKSDLIQVTISDDQTLETATGLYELILKTVDGSNTAENTYYVYVDKVKPTVNPEVETTSSSITVDANAQDAHSGVSTITYVLKDGDTVVQTITKTAEDNDKTATFTGLTQNKNYTLEVTATDYAGNISEVSTSTVHTNELTNGSLSFTEQETATQVNPLTNPTAEDLADASKQVWVNEDLVIALTQGSEGTTTYTVEKISGTPEEAAQTKTGNATIPTTEGTYKFTVTTTDGTNTTAPTTYYINVDKTNPTVAVSSNGGNYVMEVGQTQVTLSTTITGTDDVNGSGVNTLKYAWVLGNGTPATGDYTTANDLSEKAVSYTVSAGGDYYLWTKATDKAGNESITIEKTNPFTVGYRVEYDMNGGVGTIDSQVKTHGTNLALSNAVPTREGYEFKGWATSSTATKDEVEYTSGANYTTDAPVKLYAVWMEKVASLTVTDPTTHEETVTYFDSVQGAIDAAGTDDSAVVTLIKSEINEAVTVAANQTIELNTNGKTLTSELSTITNNGNLKITGTGIISSTASKVDGINKYATINYGKLEVVSGNILSENYPAIRNELDGTIKVLDGNISGSSGIYNYGNSTDEINPAINIIGGNITGKSSSGIYSSSTGKIVIANAIIKGYICGIQNDNTENIIINSGTITGETGHGIRNNKGNIELNGGTINAKNDGIWAVISGSIVVNGGTVNGGTNGIVSQQTGVPITITSGTIKATNGPGVNSRGILIIGDNADATVAGHETPIIIGKTYGITNSGTLNFYDGVIKVPTTVTAYTGTVNDTPEGYTLKIFDTETEVIDGTTYKKAYLDNHYTVTFNYNGATSGNTIANKTVTYGVVYGELPAPEKTGYTFVRWENNNNDTITASTTVATADDHTLTAVWTPNTNTAYTVYHYLQNAEDNDYTLVQTDNLTGTTDSTLTLANLTKPNTTNMPSTIVEKTTLVAGISSAAATNTTIAPDGSTVVYIYYDRNEFDLTVTAGTNTQNGTGSGTYRWGKSVVISSQLENVAGYTYSNFAWAPTSGNPTITDSTLASTTVIMPQANAEVTSTATRTAIPYTLTFDKDGGDYASGISNPSTYTVENAITLNPVSKTGYNFIGWKLITLDGQNVDNGAVVNAIPAGTTGNRTYKAQYTNGQVSYTVYHMLQNANNDNYENIDTVAVNAITGDTINLDSTLTSTISNATLIENANYKESTDGAGNKQQSVTVEADSSTKIYVYYTRKTFELTLVDGTGVSAVAGTGTYRYGQTVPILATLENLPGYTYSDFAWTTTDASIIANASSVSATVTMPAEAITVTASQTKTPHILTVKMYSNGATKNTSGENVGEIFETYVLPYDGTVGYNWPKDYKPPYGAQLVRDGYNAGGKYLVGSANSTTKINQDLVKDTTPVPTIAQLLGVLEQLNEGNVELGLYAEWTIVNYTITYDLDGGTVATSNPSTYTVESNAITLNNPTKTGYTFAGWTGTGLNQATTTVTIPTGSTGNRSYTATYTANTYTLTADANGGIIPTTTGWEVATQGATASKTVTYDGTYGTLPTPIRTGYTFTGWEDANHNVYTSTDKVNITENTTITAQWTIDTHTVTYNCNGGQISSTNTGVTITENVDYNDPINLSKTAYREGYTLLGWNTDQNATDGLSSLNMGTSNVTLYAIWQKMDVDPTEVTLDLSSETTTQPITVTGLNYGTVTYSSSDNTIATVDANGLITAVANGTATITVTGTNGSHIVTKTIPVTVVTTPTSIILNESEIIIGTKAGKNQASIQATINPATANSQNTVTWQSNNTSVATVSTSGTNTTSATITGVAEGETTVTARTANGQIANVTVKVDSTAPTVAVSMDNTNWAQSHTATITVTDALAGLPASQTIQYAWSTNGATAPAANSSDWQTVSLTATEGAKSASVQVTKNGVTGTYYLWVKAGVKDRLDNATTANYVNVATSAIAKLDNTKPVIAKAGDASTSKASPTTTITIPLSVTDINAGVNTGTAANDFTASDITVKVNGITVTPTTKTLTHTTDSNGVYNYTLTLEGVTGTGDLTLTIPANAVKDKATNGNIATTINTGVTMDAEAFNCTVTASVTSPTNATEVTYTFTFNKDTNTFTQEDIALTNGTITSFTKVSDTVYTATISNSGTCVQTVGVKANSCTDLSGNNVQAVTPVNISIDRTAPAAPAVTGKDTATDTTKGTVASGASGTIFTGATNNYLELASTDDSAEGAGQGTITKYEVSTSSNFANATEVASGDNFNFEATTLGTTYYIRAVDQAGNKSNATVVTVKKVTLAISPTSVSVENEKTTNLTATGVNAGTISWSSSDDTIATVSSTGVVTAHKVGTVTITATSGNDSTVTATSSVTVLQGIVAVPEAIDGLVYNAQTQTGVPVSANNKYTITGNTATDAGTHTATVSLSDPTNYKWSDNTTADKQITWKIAQKPLTAIAINVQDKVYDGTTQVTGAQISLSGVETSDIGKVDGTATFAFADKNVGEDKLVNVIAIALTGTKAGNYTLSNTTTTSSADITKATLTVTHTNETVTYGTAPTLGYTVTGFVGSPAETTSTAAGYIAPALQMNSTSVGTYNVTVASQGEADNYDFTYNLGTVTIQAKSVTATGMTASLAQSEYTYTGKSITPTVTIKDGTKTLTKGTDYTISYTGTTSTGAPYSSTTAPTNAGNYKVVVTGKGNYTGTKELNFTINKATLTATYANETITFGETPAFAVTVTGFVNNETAQTASGYTAPSVTCSETTVGEHSVTLTEGSADNYTFAYNIGKLIINPRLNVDILLDPTTFVYDGTAKEPVVSVYDGTTKLTQGTHYTVTYEDNINAGTAAKAIITLQNGYSGTKTETFTITKAPVTANVAITGWIYGDAANAPVPTAINSNSEDILSLYTGTKAITYNYTGTTNAGTEYNSSNSPTEAGSYTVTATFPELDNYEETTATADFIIARKTLTVSATANNKNYNNSTDATGTVILTGAVYNENPTATATFTFADKNAGTNKTVNVTNIELESPWGNNYQLNATSTTTTATINKINGTATVTIANYTYGDTPSTPVPTSSTNGTANVTYNYTGTTNAGVAYNSTTPPTEAGNYTVTATFAANTNYNQVIATKNFTVNKRTLTVTATANNKVYDGNTNATGTISLATIVSGDTVSATGTFKFANVTAGDNKTVNVTGIAFTDSAMSNNYALSTTSITTTANINKKQLTVTHANETVTYGTAPTLNYTVTGFITGENTGNAAGYTAPVLSMSKTAVGTYDVELDTEGTATNYSFTYNLGKVTITGKDLESSGITATLSPEEYTYNGVARTPTVTVKDGTKTLTKGTDYTVSYDNNTNAGTATVTITGAGNYTGTKQLTFTINKVTLGLSATVDSKPYDKTTTGTGTVSVTGGVNNETPTLANTATFTFDNKNAGTNKTVTVAGISLDANNDVNKNYQLPGTSLTLTNGEITKLELTATYAGDEITFGETPSTTVNVTGFITGENDSNAEGYSAPTVTVTATIPGTYSITPNNDGTATNYTFKLVAGTLIINEKELEVTITLNPSSYDYDGTAKEPAVTVTDNATTATLVKGTDYDVEYSNNINAGDGLVRVTLKGNYSGQGTKTFTIRKVNPTVTVSMADYTYGSTASTPVVISTGINSTNILSSYTGAKSVTYRYTGTTNAGVSYDSTSKPTEAGTYTVTATFPELDNYNQVTATDTFTVTKATVAEPTVVTGLTYNGSEQTGVASTANYSVTNGTKTNAGNYTATASLTNTNNYTWTDGTTEAKEYSWSIAKKTLTPSVTGTITKVYDGTTQVTAGQASISLSGAVTGESPTATATYAYNNANVGTGKTVTASSIALTGTWGTNYVLSKTTATTTGAITAKEMTVSKTNYSGSYDGSAHGITVTVTEPDSNYDVYYSTTPLTSSNYSNVGSTNPVTRTNAGSDTVYFYVHDKSGNYTDYNSNAKSNNGTITINKVILTPSISGTITKEYDGTTQVTAGQASISLAGSVNGEIPTATATYAYDNKNVGTGKTVTASSIALTGSWGTNYELSKTSATVKTGAITAKQLTPTVNANDKDYDGNTTASGSISLSGVVSGDTVIAAAASYAFNNKNAGSRTVTASTLTLSGADAGNYKLSTSDAASVTGTATIRKVNVTVSSLAVSSTGKVYDGTTSIPGTVTITGGVNNETPTATATFNFANKDVGTNKTINVSNIALDSAWTTNYNLSQTTGTTTGKITPATLNAKFNGKTVTYSGTPVDLNNTTDLVVTGFVSGESAANAEDYVAPTITNNYVNVNTTGYTLTPTGGSARNYTFTYTSGLLKITPRTTEAVLNINPTSYVYTGSEVALTPLTVTIGSDTLVAGTDYDITYTGTTNANVSYNSTTKPTEAGSYTATATLKGNYSGDTSENFTITRATGTASVTMADWFEGETAPNPVPVSSTNGTTGVTYKYYTNSACTTQTTTANGASTTGGKPIKAGTYWVKATFPEVANYQEVTATDEFVIEASNYEEVTSSGAHVAYYTTLADAFTNAASGNTVKPLKSLTDGSSSDTINLASGKTLTLDLNGFTVTTNKTIDNSGTLNITGTSGELTSSTVDLILNRGTFTKTGNSVLSNTGSDKYVMGNTGTATLSGGNITSTYRGVYNHPTGRLTVSGASLSAGNVTIHNAGTATGTTEPAVKVTSGSVTSSGSNTINNVSTGDIYITGGSITQTGASSVIYNTDGGKINVAGGTIAANSTEIGYGIRNGGTGEIIVSAGKITSGESSAVYNETSGTITISGGTIESESTAVYNEDVENATEFGTITVTGGTLTSRNGSGIRGGTATVNVSGNTTQITGSANGIYMTTGSVTVTGGTIEGTGTDGVVSSSGNITIGTNETPISVSTTVPSITGGSYGISTNTGTFSFYDGIIVGKQGKGSSISKDPQNVPTGYGVQKTLTTEDEITKETAIVVPANYAEYNGSNVIKYYVTLQEAFAKATSGNTIKPLVNNLVDRSSNGIENGSSEDTSKVLKFDLDGKKVTVDQLITNYGTLDIYSSSNGGQLYSSHVEEDNGVDISKCIYNLGTLTTNATNNGAYTLEIAGTATTDYLEVIRNDGIATINSNTTVRVQNAATTPNRIRYAVINRGTVTINGASIYNTPERGAGVSNASDSANARIIINTGSYIESNRTTLVNNGSTQTGNTPAILITGGTIKSNNSYGIESYRGEVVIGTNEATPSVSTTVPSITGAINGVYLGTNGKFSFYDGVIVGKNGAGSAINKYPLNVPTGYGVQKTITTEGTTTKETAILVTANYAEYNGSNDVNYYVTLADAFTNATSGNTIKPLKSLTDGSSSNTISLASGKTLILDLNGFTVTTNKTIDNSGTLTVTGSTGTLTSSTVDTITNTGTFTKSGASTISATGTSKCTIRNSGSGKVTVSAGTVTGYYAIISSGTSSTPSAPAVKVTNGTVSSTGNNTINSSAGLVYLSGGTITTSSSASTVYNGGKGTIEVDGATVSTTGSYCALKNNSTGTINVKSGTVTAKSTYAVLNYAGGAINITGGEISVPSTIANAICNNAAGSITIGTYGNTSTTSPLVTGGIVSGSSSSTGLITVNSGKVTATKEKTIETYGSVTVNGGLVENNVADTGSNWPYTIITYSNSSKITINGGTITNNTHSPVAVKNSITGTIEIYGGTISTTASSAITNNNGNTTIEGGTITSTGGAGVVTSTGIITVGNSAEPVTSVDDSTSTEPRITGSTYGVQVTSSGTFNFYDGVIKGSYDTTNGGRAIGKYPNNTPTGYEVQRTHTTTQETAILITANYLLYNGSTFLGGYSKLQDAVDNAQNGYLIKVVSDNVETSVVTIPSGKAVTLDLNGKTITTTISYARYINVNGYLTIKDSGTGGKIIGKSYGTLNANGSTAQIDILSGTIEGESTQLLLEYGGTINIKGGTVKSDGETIDIYEGHLNIINGEVISENNQTIHTHGYSNSSLVIGVNDSTVNTTSPVIYSKASWGIYLNTIGTYAFYDGVIRGKNDGYRSPLFINNEQIVDYATGYLPKSTVVGTERMITLIPATNANYVMTLKGYSNSISYYETLAEAFASAQADCDIKLLTDNLNDASTTGITLGSTSATQNIVRFDLSGKTLNLSKQITNYCNLDIYSSEGNGTLNNSAVNGLNNYGKMSFNATSSAYETRIQYTGTNLDSRVLYNQVGADMKVYTNAIIQFTQAQNQGSSTNNRYIITNHGIFTLSGGSLINNLSGTTRDWGIINLNAAAQINILSGTITTYGSALNNNAGTGTTDSTAPIIISGGTITSTNQYAIYNQQPAMINVTYGTIRGTKGIYNVDNKAGIINVTGGNIYGTTGEGIRAHSGPVTVSRNAYIQGTTYGISTTTGTVTLIDGVGVYANNGIGVSTSSGAVTVGTDDSSVGSSAPIISGKTYGVSTTGTFNFYDGKIIGQGGSGSSCSKEPDNMPTGYKRKITLSGTTETSTLDNKYRTLFVGRNLIEGVTLPNTGTSGDTFSGPTNGVYTTTIATQYGGYYIPDGILEEGKKYVLTYNIKKTAGTLTRIGGNAYSANQQVFKIDGIDCTSGTYHAPSDNITNDTNVHTIEYEFIYEPSNTTQTNKKIYIQPNRLVTTSVSLQISNVALYEVVRETTSKAYNSAYTSTELASGSITGYTISEWYKDSSLSGSKLTTSDKLTTSKATFSNQNVAGSLAYVYGKCVVNTYNITYDYNNTYTYSVPQYMDTGYILNWDKDFTIEAVVNIPTLGQRYLVFGNYKNGTTQSVSVEFNTANKIRIWMGTSEHATDGTIVANEDITVRFSWNATTKTYTATATGRNTSASITKTFNITGNAVDPLRIGTMDNRTGTSQYKSLTVKSMKITNKQTYGGNVSPFPTATLEGYTFNGWYTAASGGTQITASTPIPAANTTYYAHWTANKYKITLNNQSATTAGTTAAWYYYNTTTKINGTTAYYYSNEACTTPLSGGYNITKPTKTGYEFGGYYTETNGGGTQYVNASGSFINNAYKTAGNKTLYANWITIPTFDTGTNVSIKMKSLAGQQSPTIETVNTNITSIQKVTTIPSQYKTSNNLVSTTSSAPIYMWFDNGTIKWWCETDMAYLNSDSSWMFDGLNGLTSIDLRKFDSSKVVNMSYMFGNSGYTSIDILNWDTRNVTNMERYVHKLP